MKLKTAASFLALSFMLACSKRQGTEPEETPTAAPTAAQQEATPDPSAAATRARNEPTPSARPLAAQPAGWRPCSEGDRDVVAKFETEPGKSIQQAIDAGELVKLLHFLNPDGQYLGRWVCQTDEQGRKLVHFGSQFVGIGFGPIWEIPPVATVPGSVPPREVNLLARALSGPERAEIVAALADREPYERALNLLWDAKSSSGSWLTSGVFVYLDRANESSPVEEPLGWVIFPREIVSGKVEFSAHFYWTNAGNSNSAEWTVRPQAGELTPENEAARAIFDLAGSIPVGGTSTLVPAEPRPTWSPEELSALDRRAISWVLAEQRELATAEDWVRFHARLRPLENSRWVARSPQGDRDFRVALQFEFGRTPYSLEWDVNVDSGQVVPVTPGSKWLRAVLPTRRPGFSVRNPTPDRSQSARVGKFNLTSAEIDATVNGASAQITQCLTAANLQRVQVAWKIRWTGVPFAIEPVAQPGLTVAAADCVKAAFVDLRFPSFAGRNVNATTSFSVARVPAR